MESGFDNEIASVDGIVYERVKTYFNLNLDSLPAPRHSFVDFVSNNIITPRLELSTQI